jgi:uracil-DNA glycosylase
MCWVLLRQFKPDLTVASTPQYFAHVNSATCCQNNRGRSEASDVLFDNCRPFIPEEIRILRPDLIVTQGGRARQVIEGAFRTQREMSMGSCRAHVIPGGEREELWIQTHHPSGYGHFRRQQSDCWDAFASLVGMFAARAVPISSRPTGSTVPATPRLVKAAGGQLAGTARACAACA